MVKESTPLESDEGILLFFFSWWGLSTRLTYYMFFWEVPLFILRQVLGAYLESRDLTEEGLFCAYNSEASLKPYVVGSIKKIFLPSRTVNLKDDMFANHVIFSCFCLFLVLRFRAKKKISHKTPNLSLCQILSFFRKLFLSFSLVLSMIILFPDCCL